MRTTLIVFFILFFIRFSFGQDSLLNRANLLFEQASYPEAYNGYQEAGNLFQKAGRYEMYALTHIQMSFALSRQGLYHQALSLSDSTLAYINEGLPENNFLIAESLRSKGDALLNLGKNDEALENLLSAERKYPEDAVLEKAHAFNLLGIIYLNNQNRELAIQYTERALDIRKSKLGVEALDVADSYNNLGLMHTSLDDTKAGLEFNNALKIYRVSLSNNNPKVAQTLINIGLTYSRQGRIEEAVSKIEEARQILENIHQGNHPAKTFSIAALGLAYEENGNYERAQHFQELALRQYIQIFGAKHPEVANTYFLIGRLFQKKNDFKSSVEAFQNSIYSNLLSQDFTSIWETPSPTNYLNADYLLRSLMGKANALEALHFEKSLKARDLKTALDTYQVADTLVTEIRKIRVTENDKIRLGEISRTIYENGIRLALVLSEQPFNQAKYFELAFRFCERSKSSVLLEAIQETNAKSFSGIPGEILAYEDSLKAEIAFYDLKMTGDDFSKEDQSILLEYRQAYRDHIQNLELNYPKYFNLKYQAKPFDVDNLKLSIDSHQALISYFEGEEFLYQFIITEKKLDVRSIQKDEYYAQNLKALRNSIKYQIPQTYNYMAELVHEVLIPDLASDIIELILIPDGILNTIPFEVLKNPQSQKSLIQEFSISYDYSANLITERKSQAIDVSSEMNNILLIAPIEFHLNKSLLNNLPATEKETREINYLFKGHDWGVKRLVKADANETFIKSSDLTQYRYLHFATHGVVNESEPALSQIYLYPENEEDGSLYSGDIYNLKIKAELVCLSACETGLGKLAKGEGIVGLSRALMYAGAQNLLVSLWQVSDESTSEMMIEFYRQHLFYDHYSDFNQALRQAKLQMLESDRFSDPYFWAPFILVGQ